MEPGHMIFECKVFSAQGELKQVLDPERIIKKHWEGFWLGEGPSDNRNFPLRNCELCQEEYKPTSSTQKICLTEACRVRLRRLNRKRAQLRKQQQLN